MDVLQDEIDYIGALEFRASSIPRDLSADLRRVASAH